MYFFRFESLQASVLRPRRGVPHLEAGHQRVRVRGVVVRARGAAGVRVRPAHVRQRVRDAAEGVSDRGGDQSQIRGELR